MTSVVPSVVRKRLKGKQPHSWHFNENENENPFIPEKYPCVELPDSFQLPALIMAIYGAMRCFCKGWNSSSPLQFGDTVCWEFFFFWDTVNVFIYTHQQSIN